MFERTITLRREHHAAAPATVVAGMLSLSLALTGLGTAGIAILHGGAATTAPPIAQVPAAQALAHLPVSFEPNVGQVPSPARFIARGSDFTAYLMPIEAVVVANAGGTVRMRLAGGNPAADIAGQDRQAGIVNYLIGNDPARWHTGVATYAKVTVSGVYPGIDMVYRQGGGGLEYDFQVAAGADTAVIGLFFADATAVAIDQGTGDLLVTGAAGAVLRQHAPTVFQAPGGVRQDVGGHFVLRGSSGAGFDVGPYDHSLALTIDPSLAYSTMLGGHGNNGDIGNAIAVDRSGDAYVAGQTGSLDFPVTRRAFQTSVAPSAVTAGFVTKMNATGTGLVYSTYLGGSAMDLSTAVAVDAEGYAYVVSQVQSTDFPVTPGAFQTICTSCAGYATTVTKLNLDGSAPVYSTFVDGRKYDSISAIAVDGAGNAYLAGFTLSRNFPVTPGAFQATCGDCIHGGSAFVTKLNPAGSGLVYSTFLGGTTATTGEGASGIAIDSSGNAYVVGSTSAPDFPTTPGAFQSTCPEPGAGCAAAFITKLNPAGSAPVYSTFLGGPSAAATASSVSVDSAGHAYVAGATDAADFPVTRDAFQRIAPPGANGFISEVGVHGRQLVYSTFLGGNGQTSITCIALDPDGLIVVGGVVLSTTFPVKNPIQVIPPTSLTQDAFISVLNPRRGGPDGLVMSSHLGSSSNDNGTAVAVGPHHNAYLTGYAQSIKGSFRPQFPFPTTPGAFQHHNTVSYKGFVTDVHY